MFSSLSFTGIGLTPPSGQTNQPAAPQPATQNASVATATNRIAGRRFGTILERTQAVQGAGSHAPRSRSAAPPVASSQSLGIYQDPATPAQPSAQGRRDWSPIAGDLATSPQAQQTNQVARRSLLRAFDEAAGSTQLARELEEAKEP